jgi:uncharacterized phage protein gp47/JayE
VPTEFQRPTPAELIARIATDIEGALVGVNALLRATVEYVLARALGGVFHGVHGHLAWIAEQIFPDQAVDRFVVRAADFWGVPRRQASKAHRILTVLGTGGTLAAGEEFVRLADGFSFTVDASAFGVTSSQVAITASLPGAIGNLRIGEKVMLLTGVDGVTSEATVTALGVDGADIESIPALVLRILDRIQNPPRGGAPGDYETWAKEVPGVTRAWEFPRQGRTGDPGLGRVALTFVMDNNADPIPSADTVELVRQYVQARAPSQVICFAPTPEPYDYNVRPVPNTPAVRAAIEAEVTDMIRRDAEPGGTISVSRFNEAVSIADGEISHNTISPVADKTHAFGVIAVPGTATFSS